MSGKLEQFLVQNRISCIVVGTEEYIPGQLNVGRLWLVEPERLHARKQRDEMALTLLKTNDSAKLMINRT
jgi:hypothetical protein